MKKTTLIKTMLLLCALVAGSGSVWAQTFTKITSLDEVSDGCSYLFVYENGASGVAMSTTQNTDNRAGIGVTITDNTITYASGLEVITLESTGTVNQYYLRGSNGKYLIAVEGKNTLKSSDTKNNAGKFTFAYSETVLSITSTLPAGNISTWNPSQLRFNSGSNLFSCYGTGQRAITLFKEVATPWESTSKGIDVLTYSTLGLSGDNGYLDFSNVSSDSHARYAGNAYKTNTLTYIQIKKDSPSGIVTTTSGGKARKVVIDWNASTVDGRIVQIYGKNAAYEGSADLFNNEKYGTLIGTIIKGTSTELVIYDDYQYIGVKTTGGSAYMQSITIYWEGDGVSLSDASNYTPEAKDYAKVTLNRSFVEGWNGVILPFDLTTSVKAAMGATEVKTLESASESAGTITLNFTDASLPVAAGTPVLIKLNDAIASGDFIMNGVEIKTSTPTTIEKTVAGNTFTLTGTYSTTDLEASEVYLVSNDKFYHKDAGVALTAKPFRAYITQTVSVGSRLNVFFDLEDGGTTGIHVVNNDEIKDNRFYDLQGRRVAQPTKGLYIVNGRKVIIK